MILPCSMNPRCWSKDACLEQPFHFRSQSLLNQLFDFTLLLTFCHSIAQNALNAMIRLHYMSVCASKCNMEHDKYFFSKERLTN